MPEHGPATARQLWRLLEPIHAVTYFSPEPLATLRQAGYRGFWMGYFAGRAAPLGAASAELVHALFYNFTFERVARALPDAWSYAPPEEALRARSAGSVAALRRHLGARAESPEVVTAAHLASAAADGAPLEGRPLFAANRSVPATGEPLALLWEAATRLREHRGDGHVAALVACGISGRESHVLQSMATGTPRAVYDVARDFTDEEWAIATAALRGKGYVEESAGLTPAGTAVKRRIEAITDEAACGPFDLLDPAELDTLVDALRPLTAAVVASGEIPALSPMGLDLDPADVR